MTGGRAAATASISEAASTAASEAERVRFLPRESEAERALIDAIVRPIVRDVVDVALAPIAARIEFLPQSAGLPRRENGHTRRRSS